MSIKTVEKLFKEPAQWPLIPPWWLLPSPQAAALLNIKPATLQSWRIRGEGPEPVPPMYLHPTQGDPMYYRYGDIREWAASSLGMAFPFKEQCRAFLQDVDPQFSKQNDPIDSLCRMFDWILQFDRERIKLELEPLVLGTQKDWKSGHVLLETATFQVPLNKTGLLWPIWV